MKSEVFGMGDNHNSNSISLYAKVDLSESYLTIRDRKRISLRIHIIKNHNKKDYKDIIHIDPTMNGVIV